MSDMARIVEELSVAHHRELAILHQRIMQLEWLLAEHGVEIPDADSQRSTAVEHLEACRRVVAAAYDLIPHLDALREMVGSGVELMTPSWRD